MATSGTVALTPYNQAKVIEHAMRRAGFRPEKMGAENILIAQETLFTMLSEYVNPGFPLWTRQSLLLGVAIGSPSVITPAGTVEVLHSYWRTLQPYRGTCGTSSGGFGSNTLLFSGAPGGDTVLGGPNPWVAVNFTGPTEVDTIGVLIGAGALLTAVLLINTSPDGVTWTTVRVLPSTTFVPGVWTYFDLDPSINAQYVQLQCVTGGSWSLNQLNFGLANSAEVELGLENIDSYYNLPNKFFQGDRPNTVYQDRQIIDATRALAGPVLKIWPTPSQAAFYNGTVTALTRRYIQDPGEMTNSLEVPPRWLEAVQWRLAHKLIFEIPEENNGQANFASLALRSQRIKDIDAAATKAEALMWAEERNRAPIRIAPSIRPYTR